MGFRKKLLIGFSAIMIIMVFLGVFGLYEMKSINNNVKEIYNVTLKGVYYLKDAHYNIIKAQRVEKNVLLSKTKDEKMEHTMHLDETYTDGIIKNLNLYMALSAGEGNEAEIEALISKVNDVKKIQSEVIDKSMAGSEDEALALSQNSAKAFDKIDTLITELSQHELAEADDTFINSNSTYNKSFLIFIGIIFFALIAGAFIMSRMAASVIKPLKRSVRFADELSKGNLNSRIDIRMANDEIGMLVNSLNNTGEKLSEIVSEIKKSSMGLEESTEQLNMATEESNQVMDEIGVSVGAITDNIEQVVSSIEHISSNLKNIVINADEVSKLTQEANTESNTLIESAKKGRSSVDILIHNTKDIEKSTNEVHVTIDDLQVLSGKIDNIITVIKDIAAQTNLLALNASIEAARAGEHGRGFMVVAEEVRKLADGSAVAAADIENTIIEVQNKTNIAVQSITITEKKVIEGNQAALVADTNLTIILDSIAQLAEKIRKISVQSEEQANSAENISEHMDQAVINSKDVAQSAHNINGKIGEQIAAIQEISAVSNPLLMMTENLNKMIQYFQTTEIEAEK
ncbi:Methyl-accepting chemotaxis protein [Acetoanaerobium noterae]|uniref:Methyl-accepting chemotaxis protein n=1 Tax=Acetoanaerobium noterae TaxID=745369 RepID=A0A1T5CET9_9FIRM|nr:methyl-accepting chemotaxis protein [Acetoanaerobium noterae]SKB58042.1 Methyl-accepting chemotaxis protein [Acetoanaerobium noterae]